MTVPKLKQVLFLTPVLSILMLLGVLDQSAQASVSFRISTENTENHVQTRMVQVFVDLLKERTQGQLDVQYSHSAALYRDRDVIKALNDGKIEMAVPGMWQLDRFEPNVGLFTLPIFYGRPRQDHYRARDGDLGQAVNAMLEDSTGTKVLGPWVDLGHAHLYFTETKVQTLDDLAGLDIRIAGGVTNRSRISDMGARPVLIAWPDLPAALQDRQVAGILTTHETVASAKLWTYGLKYCLEDQQYFAQYVPLVSGEFWSTIDPDLRAILTETWLDSVEQARQEAADAQASARQTLIDHGVEIVTPSAEQIRTWRALLMRQQDRLAKEMGVDPALLQRASGAFGDPQ